MRITLDHWFIGDSQLSISLINFYVSIDIKHNGDFIYFPLYVYNSNGQMIRFNFYSLEEAVTFAEKLNGFFTNEEVLEYYENLFKNGKLKASPKIKKKK